MDAPVEPDHAKAEQALRALFQEAGLVSAPGGMEARIMQRISVTAVRPLGASAPLLPKWTWIIAALAAIAVIVLFVLSDTASTPTWSLRLPSFSLKSVMGTKWVLGTALCAAGLLVLDTWLRTKRLAFQQR